LDNNEAQVKQGEIEASLSITIEEDETKEQSKRGKIETSDILQPIVYCS
jgi:hypothetical protein